MMKSAKDHGVMNTDGIDVNVDALLAAINEISESEVHRSEDDPHHVSIDTVMNTHGASWPKPLSLIFMTLALLKPIAKLR